MTSDPMEQLCPFSGRSCGPQALLRGRGEDTRTTKGVTCPEHGLSLIMLSKDLGPSTRSLSRCTSAKVCGCRWRGGDPPELDPAGPFSDESP